VVSIDGSIGEGGGQVLRVAVAMAAIMDTALKVTNIRANRDPPGLKASHATAVKAVAQLCDAELEGAEVGSTELRFRPQGLHGGTFSLDVGTAGSVTLVLQAMLPPAISCGERVEVELRGGTDVPYAPTVKYLEHVLLPVLRAIGADVQIEVKRRGFYPEGGGAVRVVVEPGASVKPLAPTGPQPRGRIEGEIAVSKLGQDVTDRIRRSMVRRLQGLPLGVLDVDLVEANGEGVSATLWAPRRAGAVGGSDIGKRGYPAEKLGETAATAIARALRADADVDEHLLDQVLIYNLMATGRSSFSCDAVSSHAETVLAVAKEFTNFSREIQNDGRRKRVVIDGEGL
jgi:RNA 3'-terminal phosphate cyclase (ATP)